LPPAVAGRQDVTVRLGWWGYSERAHNEWATANRVIAWGVPQLSPAAQEQSYCAERAAIGLPPAWDPTRTQREYPIPGQPGGHIDADGWADDAQDAWAREWTTSRVVQAIGRMRAVARPHDQMRVDVWTTVPLAEVHGMRVDRIVADAPWRTAAEYHAGRTDDADHRCRAAIVGLRTDGQVPTRAAVDAWLRARGMTGVAPRVYQRVQAAVPEGYASIRMRYRRGGLTRIPVGRVADAAYAAVGGAIGPLPQGWRDATLARRLAALRRAPKRPARGRAADPWAARHAADCWAALRRGGHPTEMALVRCRLRWLATRRGASAAEA
jgi:hypothetical protein